MSDLKFDYTPLMYATMEASRASVLRPILKGIKKEKALKRNLEGQHELLQQMWRLRVVKLGEKGWSRAAPKNGLQYLRNCPPFGVRFGERFGFAHRCDCRRVCPNCFAKGTILETLRSITWAFYLSNNKPVVVYDLVACRRSWVRDVPLDDALKLLKENRNIYRKKFKTAVGGITVSTIEPAKGGWKIQIGTLVMVMPGDEPDLGQADVRRVSVDKLTKGKIYETVGWAVRYPLGMMYGDEARTVQILAKTSTSLVRQFVASGAMRNGTQRGLVYR
jgi:hypothetical protein